MKALLLLMLIAMVGCESSTPGSPVDGSGF
jgi:hypothetical protein